MSLAKKCVAEFIGTMVLVIMGCGTAMLVGCDAVQGGGYVLTAFAFGLTIVGMAYCVGNISGCHINPAVSLGVLMSGGMSGKEFAAYVVSQCIGALAGAGVLALIFSLGGVVDMTDGFGSNGLSGVNGSAVAGLVVEIVLTFICDDDSGSYLIKGEPRFFCRSCNRIYSYFGTYSGYRSHGYIGKPCEKYRSRYCGSYFGKPRTHILHLDFHCWTFGRCSHCSFGI